MNSEEIFCTFKSRNKLLGHNITEFLINRKKSLATCQGDGVAVTECIGGAG